MGENADREGQAKCEISGEWVPEDEIIEFQGHQVSAKGKEILLERLKSGEAMPGEMEKPSVFLRFGCIFVDGLVLAVVQFGVTFAFIGAFVLDQNTITAANQADMMASQGMASMVVILVGIAYFSFFHGTKGQTLGKMAGKIKVVMNDGSDISMGRAVLRALAYQGLGLIPPVMMISGALEPMVAASLLVSVYGLAQIIVALVDRSKQRAIHDFIAGTRVIKVG